MDPITHSLVGGLAAKTVGTSDRRFWVMTVLGMAPDLDVLFNAFGSWAFWLQHRGLSHSLFGVAVQAFLYSWFLRKWDPGSFKERTFHYALPLALHSLCDFFTSYGVPLLSPFSFHDFSADLMGGLALLPIAFMSLGLLRMHKNGLSGWKAARPMWIGWTLTFMVALSGRAYATKLMQTPRPSMTIVPSVANPFVWSVIDPNESNGSYDHYEVNLFEGIVGSKRMFPMPDIDGPIQMSLNSIQVQEFLQDSRWPVSRTIPSGEGWIVEWGQILFSTRGIVRGKLRITLDSKGNIIREDKIFNFWNPTPA